MKKEQVRVRNLVEGITSEQVNIQSRPSQSTEQAIKHGTSKAKLKQKHRRKITELYSIASKMGRGFYRGRENN